MCFHPEANKLKYGNLPSYPNTTHILTFIFLTSSLLRTRLHSLIMASGMITPSLFLSLVCLVTVVSASDGNESDGCSGTANYVLSFYGLWKKDRHPNVDVPGNAHFSPLVGCSHGSDYVMWREGEKASAGVKLVAERGKTDTLKSEIDTKITEKKAWKIILPGGPQLGPEAMKTGIDVEVTANFSKVSIITMLAPSPDWFIGIDSVDLCDNSTWRESMNVTMLPPWDAGTDDGTGFSSTNAATNPPVNITEITNNMAGVFNAPNPIASLGEFRFVKTDEPAEPTEPMKPGIPTESSGRKASFHFAVFTSTALMLALLF